MRIWYCLLIVLLLMTGAAQAAEVFGTVDDVAGAASIAEEDGTSTAISTGATVYVGQSIVTGTDGEVHIVTADSGLIALRPNSRFRIDRYQAKGEESDEIVFSLLKGALRSISGWVAKHNPACYRLNAGTTTIGIRGTDHETAIIETPEGSSQPGVYDTVYEGATVLNNEHGKTEVHSGETAYAAHNVRMAPGLLARRPEFMERRALRIEQRIQQRKEILREVIRNRMQARTAARERRLAAHKNREAAREEHRLHKHRNHHRTE